MGPRQAWTAFALLVVLVDSVAMIALVELGYPGMVAIPSGLIFLLLCFYVIYKRYHVEVVPESDIALFTEPDDLRILCEIYGLDETGSESDLRERLVKFSRANSSRAFAWVAPRLVRSIGAALELPEAAETEVPRVDTRPLTGGKERSESRLRAIDLCPVCDARLPAQGMLCSGCGADLEFYSVLRESKVGRRLVSAKGKAVRRKLRYEVPSLGDRK